ncbi:hypothetical protein T01_13731 [Trichinella spiralis]|uniref:Uncharacterized protein n=1 Tax=Trichinella spiralis TaxID=6334 RepID=A0A0V1BW99_TRISP|nr:hypothetical protein T01_13731 [Trichinella spiralis]
MIPGWDNLKGPIPAPAVTLSQQPYTSLGGKNQYIIDRSCRVADKRGYFRARGLYIVCRAWSHIGKCAAVSRMVEALLASSSNISITSLIYPMRTAVSTRQAADDGKMRGGLPGSFPHAHL